MKKLLLTLIVAQLPAQSVLLYQSRTTRISVPAITSAANSELIQIGERNAAEANLLSGTLQLQQIGNQNQLHLTESNSYIESKTGVEIYGSNNLIDIIGNNSISEKMTIRVSGNDKAVIVRNY